MTVPLAVPILQPDLRTNLLPRDQGLVALVTKLTGEEHQRSAAVAVVADQVPVISNAADELPTRFDSDLLFSRFDPDGADSLFPGEAFAGPLDWAWGSVLSVTSAFPRRRGQVAMWS